MQPGTYGTADAAANLRRASILSAVLAVAAIAVAAALGHPWFGVFGALGLALGAANNRLLQRSVIRFGEAEAISRKQFTRGVAIRLLGLTLVAIAVALLIRPDGLGIFAGLAVFQIIMLIGAALPVFRSLRPTS
jgi:hypothetical protein